MTFDWRKPNPMTIPREFSSSKRARYTANLGVVLALTALLTCLVLFFFYSRWYFAAGAGVAALLFCFAWQAMLVARRRIVTDPKHLIEVRPDWLLRKSIRPIVRVFPYAMCRLTTKAESNIVKEATFTRVDSTSSVTLPASLVNFSELVAFLREQMNSNDVAGFDTKYLDTLLKKGLTLRYGTPAQATQNSSIGVSSAISFVLSMVGGAVGSFAGNLLAHAAEAMLSNTAGSLSRFAGTRIRLEYDGIVRESLFGHERIAYRDVRQCSHVKRYSQRALGIMSSQDTIYVYDSLVGFDLVERVFKARCKPDIWPKHAFPWELQLSSWGVVRMCIVMLILFIGATCGYVFAVYEKGPLEYTWAEWSKLLGVAALTITISLGIWFDRRRRYVFTKDEIELHRRKITRRIPISSVTSFRIHEDGDRKGVDIEYPGGPLQITQEITRVSIAGIIDALRSLYPTIAWSSSDAMSAEEDVDFALSELDAK